MVPFPLIFDFRFPLNYKANITSTSIIVQGELEISSNQQVSPDNESVRFILTGTDDVFWVPSDSNSGVCGDGACLLGKKPFLVAGGKLNINSFPDGCPTWVSLKDVMHGNKESPTLVEGQGYPHAPVLGCDPYGTVLFEDFTGGYGGFTGGDGTTCTLQDGTMTVRGHNGPTARNWQGPRIDYTHQADCIIPDTPYIVTVRAKIDKEGMSGQPTECHTDNINCLKLLSITQPREGGDIWSNKAHLRQGYGGVYGEWITLVGDQDTAKWSAAELDASRIFNIMRVITDEVAVSITIDFVEIRAANEAHYPNITDPCNELVANGNAEQSITLNPFPISSNAYWHSSLAVQEELDESGETNRYFAMYRRSHSWISPSSELNLQCFSSGLVYTASFKLRVLQGTTGGYFELGWHRQDDSWKNRNVMDLPSQSVDAGWVSYSGDFIIDEDIANAKDMIWRIIIEGGETRMDYDDVSIKFKSGAIEGILVDSSVTSCWGPGSEIHITSSTFDPSESSVKTIDEVVVNNDGTATIKLPALDWIPVSESEDITAAEVALLTRNVKIEATKDVEYEGGYVQVLHTPGIAQTVDGVEFRNMGQRGVLYRYVCFSVYLHVFFCFVFFVLFLR